MRRRKPFQSDTNQERTLVHRFSRIGRSTPAGKLGPDRSPVAASIPCPMCTHTQDRNPDRKSNLWLVFHLGIAQRMTAPVGSSRLVRVDCRLMNIGRFACNPGHLGPHNCLGEERHAPMVRLQCILEIVDRRVNSWPYSQRSQDKYSRPAQYTPNNKLPNSPQEAWRAAQRRQHHH
jgi:hypothetical protein